MGGFRFDSEFLLLDWLVTVASVFRDLRSGERLNLQFQSIGGILIGRGVSY